jgi:hypothetical protein
VWSAIIFNIERFIVSSSGKGDGTEKITLSEIGNALPRIIMGAIIGVTLSAPLEIRILESEINAKLQEEQIEYKTRLNSTFEAAFEVRKTELTGKIADAQARLDQIDADLEMRRQEINAQRQKLEDEAEGRSGSGKPGRGPAYLDKKANLDSKQAELEYDKSKAADRVNAINDELAIWKAELTASASELEQRRADNERQSHALDGLLKRIQISHEIGGAVPKMIAALLMCIELGPIFFKMMLTRGVYEVLVETQGMLVRAQAGIDGETRDDVGHLRSSYRSHAYDAIVEEHRRRADTERHLAELVHEQFRRIRGDELRADPLSFIADEPAAPRSPSSEG